MAKQPNGTKKKTWPGVGQKVTHVLKRFCEISSRELLPPLRAAKKAYGSGGLGADIAARQNIFTSVVILIILMAKHRRLSKK